MNFKIELTLREILLTLLKKNKPIVNTDVFGVFQIINIPLENILGSLYYRN